MIYRGSKEENQPMLNGGAKIHHQSLSNERIRQIYKNPLILLIFIIQGAICHLLGGGLMYYFTNNQPCPDSLNSVDPSNDFIGHPVQNLEAEASLFIANKNCPHSWEPYFVNASRAISDRGSMDYIIVAGRLTCVLSWNIFSILKYQNPKRVLIITLKSVCADMILVANVHCIDEQTWVKGLKIDGYRKYFEKKMDVVGSRIFWYWQQMLKMGSAFRDDLSDEFVLVDADVIFQRRFMYKDDQGRYIFIPGGGKTREYYDPVENFLGHRIQMPKGRKSSFVSHSMIMNKPFLKSLLEKRDKLWWKEIIDLVAKKYYSLPEDVKKWVKERHRLYGFSEYMYYTSAFIKQSPEKYVEGKTQFIRDKEINNAFGDFCPTIETMEKVKKDSEDQQDTPIVVWELEHGSVSQGSKNEKSKATLHAPYPACDSAVR